MIGRSGRPRIVLYSHDTMGLGHVRRNLLLARTLVRSHLEPNVLLLSGAVDAKSFRMPNGVDMVTLPSLFKEEDGQYESRRLNLALPEMISLRREILSASIAAFEPDLLIVDTAPWGVAGELDSTLERLTDSGRTRCVLGMRDIWDEPSAISREWVRKKNWEAVERYYEQVWVYGDSSVYDVIREYEIGESVAKKFVYTGYLGRLGLHFLAEDYREIENLHLSESPFVLCLMGGGQDGMGLAQTFLEADLPMGRTGLVITGPFVDPIDLNRLRTLARANPRMQVIDFVPEPVPFIDKAESVVSMGGYNAVCEILSFRKRALIVPRISPRKEQLIRAERLGALGFVEVLRPEDLGPNAVTNFLQSESWRFPSAIPFDMNGLTRVLGLAESLMTGDGDYLEGGRQGGGHAQRT